MSEQSIVQQHSSLVDSAMVFYQGGSSEKTQSVVSRESSFSSTDVSVSRNSSCSSYSSSTTGSSGGAFGTDSGRSSSKGFTCPDIGVDSSLTMPKSLDDFRSAGRLKSRMKSRFARYSLEMLSDGDPLSKRCHSPFNPPSVEGEVATAHPYLPERSISELTLSTHLKASDNRVRSKSESCGEKNAPTIRNHNEEKKDTVEKKAKRSESRESRVDCSIDETAINRCLVLLEASYEGRKEHHITDSSKRISELRNQVEQISCERDVALRERDEMMYDRDRIQCERDALELERDNLLRDKEVLGQELANRSNVIEHLKEHLGMAVLPVKLNLFTLNSTLSVTKEKSLANSTRDAPTGTKLNTRSRSKSEIRPPEFYFPDQIAKTNAHTCL